MAEISSRRLETGGPTVSQVTLHHLESRVGGTKGRTALELEASMGGFRTYSEIRPTNKDKVSGCCLGCSFQIQGLATAGDLWELEKTRDEFKT